MIIQPSTFDNAASVMTGVYTGTVLRVTVSLSARRARNRLAVAQAFSASMVMQRPGTMENSSRTQISPSELTCSIEKSQEGDDELIAQPF